MWEGKFNDIENGSWDISKDIDTEYMYYKGGFKDGKASHDKDSIFINNLSKQQIQDILKENLNLDIDVELKWKFDED